MGVTLQEARSRRALEYVIVGLLDLGLPLDVGLVKVEQRGLFLVDLLGDAYVTEQVRGQRSVDIVADRLERHRDTRKVEIVLAEAGHGLEVKILAVDVRHLRIVTEMELEFAAVVVARETELLETGNDRLVDDLHDIRLLLERTHAVIEAPVFQLGD